MRGEGAVRLAAVVNSYNRLDLLREALPSLVAALAGCPFGTAIVVFDAGSDDGSPEWLKKYKDERHGVFLDVLQIAAAADGSLSAGVNAGIDFSLHKYAGLEWLFLFETDNWIETPAPVMAAMELLENVPDLAAAGFTVKQRNGQAAGFGCRFPTAVPFILGQQLTDLLRLDSPRIRQWHDTRGVQWAACDAVYTSPLLIRCKAWEQIGGLDARRFPFCDTDVDWSWRAWRQGWRVAVISTSEVVHDNRGIASEWSGSRVLDFHRARLRLLEKHSNAALWLVQALLLVRHCCEILILLLSSWRLADPRRALRQRWTLLNSVRRGYEY